MTIRYLGRRNERAAQIVKEGECGAEEALPPRLDLRNHSPAGLEWGYAGSGPAQLALALLADALGEEEALASYQRFKFEVVSRLSHQGWEMPRAEIETWWDNHRGAKDHE